MIRALKTIYDFFRLWIMWGDRREAWQDAKFKNDPKFQAEMEELDIETIYTSHAVPTSMFGEKDDDSLKINHKS